MYIIPYNLNKQNTLDKCFENKLRYVKTRENHTTKFDFRLLLDTVKALFTLLLCFFTLSSDSTGSVH